MVRRFNAFSLVPFFAVIALPTLRADELVVNGNFEQGNKDFQSKFKFSVGNILDGLKYDVVKNPKDAHRDAAVFGDHTSGKGHMLAFNGQDAVEKTVWEQTIDIRPDSECVFSFWVAAWYSLSEGQLDVRINGKSVGKANAPKKTGEWEEFKVKWNSGNGRSATIEIVNLSRSALVIDDISLQGPSALPADAEKRMRQFDSEAEGITKKADAEVNTRREELIKDLQKMQEAYTKEGKLDEALTIRNRIQQLKAKVEKPKGKD